MSFRGRKIDYKNHEDQGTQTEPGKSKVRDPEFDRLVDNWYKRVFGSRFIIKGALRLLGREPIDKQEMYQAISDYQWQLHKETVGEGFYY